MAKLPQRYEEMIASGAALRDFRVSLIGELDNLERGQTVEPAPLANELGGRLGEIGMALFEADDGVVDFNAESDIDMVKGALCTNFSKEKFTYAEKLIRANAPQKGRTGRQPKVQIARSVDSLSDLRAKAEAGEIPPPELKRNLKIAILRELDADRQRDLPIAEAVAEEAEEKLAKKGERLYEDDDGTVEFCSVGRPNVTEDTLHLVKGALASNFSRAKLQYASKLQAEFRRRGYDKYQVKRQKLGYGNQQQGSDGSHAATRSYATPKMHAAGSFTKWILAAAIAAVLVIVPLIIKSLKK